MLSVEHTVLLTVGFLPYLALGLYDSWMHGTARRVPVLEKILHALVGLSLTALWIGLLRHPGWVIPALTVFIVVGAWDELGYHGHLAPRERRVHHFAYGCFAGFIALAWAIGAVRWE